MKKLSLYKKAFLNPRKSNPSLPPISCSFSMISQENFELFQINVTSIIFLVLLTPIETLTKKKKGCHV